MKERKMENRWKNRDCKRSTGVKSIQNRRCMAHKFNQLKGRLTHGLAGEAGNILPAERVNHAVADAEALAWSTSYPLLFLPGLVEEKVASAHRWEARQREILKRQQELAEIF